VRGIATIVPGRVRVTLEMATCQRVLPPFAAYLLLVISAFGATAGALASLFGNLGAIAFTAMALAAVVASWRAYAWVRVVRVDHRSITFRIRRADYAGDPWSGQVALPGGRHEPGDPSLEATAVRETFEETGVDLTADGALLGTLDEIYPRTPILPPIVVRPHVFAITRPVELTLSHEVAAAFWMPLASLRDPAASVETTVVVRGEERVVSCFRHREHVIWGLTERILRQLVASIP
jgi:8-oxo-dGTP pyrophosphatase MutT (NUDIX family)